MAAMTLPAVTPAVGKLAPGPGQMGMRSQEVRPPEAGEVTLEVLAAGICGTDLHIADDEFPSLPPVTMGHEVTGEVAVVGDGIDPKWLGQRVTVETYVTYCGACGHCRSGRPNLCDDRRSIGSHVDGGYARWLTLPVRNLHPLPESIGLHAGALAEPLACVANCLFDPGVVDPGDLVLITGPGTMGVLAAQAARAAGGHVLLAGLPADRVRLEIAAGLGLEVAVVDDVDRLPDVAIDCSGAPAAAGWLLERVRKGGTYVQVGIFGRPVEIDLDAFLYKEVRFRSGFASTPRSWRRAMALLGQGAVVLDPLVSEVVPLDEWERAFDATRRGEGMKFVLDPRAST